MTIDEKFEMRAIVLKLKSDADVGRMNELLNLALAEAEEKGRKKGIQECIDKMEEFYKKKGILEEEIESELGFNPFQE